MTARSDIDEGIFDEALAWQRALERDDADWDAYAAWLEADPRHREAFDALELVNRAVDERAADLKPLLTPDPAAVSPAMRRGWLVGSLAVAIAAVVLVPGIWLHAKEDTVYATRAGETRTLTLQDGINVDLAPASTLIARGGDSANLQLASGEAYFAVAHDPNRTLRIEAANYTVSDIGTQFGVNVGPERVTIAVAEGRVSVGSQSGEPTRVVAGQQIVAARREQTVRLLPAARHDVGSWRRGRLVYSNTPLSVVAADLSRFSGKTVSIDPSIQDQEFSGVLAIASGATVFDDLAGLAGIMYREQGGRVRLSPSPSR